MSPQELSQRIITGIFKKPNVFYSVLENHAQKLGIEPRIFEAAMAIVQKNRNIQTKIKAGELVYGIKEIAPKKEPGSHLIWARNNYPDMGPKCTLCTHGCAECVPFFQPGIDDDPRHLMMTREEYKAKVRGVAYIPKKQYDAH